MKIVVEKGFSGGVIDNVVFVNAKDEFGDPKQIFFAKPFASPKEAYTFLGGFSERGYQMLDWHKEGYDDVKDFWVDDINEVYERAEDDQSKQTGTFKVLSFGLDKEALRALVSTFENMNDTVLVVSESVDDFTTYHMNERLILTAMKHPSDELYKVSGDKDVFASQQEAVLTKSDKIKIVEMAEKHQYEDINLIYSYETVFKEMFDCDRPMLNDDQVENLRRASSALEGMFTEAKIESQDIRGDVIIINEDGNEEKVFGGYVPTHQNSKARGLVVLDDGITASEIGEIFEAASDFRLKFSALDTDYVDIALNDKGRPFVDERGLSHLRKNYDGGVFNKGPLAQDVISSWGDAVQKKIEAPATVFVLTIEQDGWLNDPEAFSSREKAEKKFIKFVNERYDTTHETYEEADEYLTSQDDACWSTRIDDIAVDSTVGAEQKVQNISSADVDGMSKEERVAAVDKLSEIPVLSDDYKL